MERDRLAQLLDREGEVFTACRQALLSGARFWVSDLSQPASELVGTYARRDQRARQVGIRTLGLPAAVDALREHGEQPVSLGVVDVEDPPYHFQLFLDQHHASVVACLGIDQDPSRRQQYNGR
jgi:hypothetical protein